MAKKEKGSVNEEGDPLAKIVDPIGVDKTFMKIEDVHGDEGGEDDVQNDMPAPAPGINNGIHNKQFVRHIPIATSERVKLLHECFMSII